jgi:hypothetical protein
MGETRTRYDQGVYWTRYKVVHPGTTYTNERDDTGD